MTIFDRTIEYIRASRAELQKVSWPSQHDTIRYSALVVAISVIVAIFFGLLDTGLGKLVESVISRAPASDVAAPADTTPTTSPTNTAPPVTLTPSDVQTQPAAGAGAGGSAKIQVTPLTPTAPPKP